MSEFRLSYDHASFSAFAHSRLNTVALDVQSDADDVRHFYDLLMSALHYTVWPAAPRNAAGDELQVVAGYVELMRPNALADHEGGRHYIAMNTALFAAIHEFTMFCFTQADFFPEVGDPALEASPSPLDARVPGIWLLDFTREGGRVEERQGKQITPRGQSRYVASVYLAYLMARFVWLHEFQHCLSGHVRYVQERQGRDRLSEVEEPVRIFAPNFGEDEDELLRRVILRCLEFDADQSAFFACVNIQIGNGEIVEGISALDPDLRLRLAIFGAYAMTSLFEEFQKYMNVQAGITHPQPYLRLQNLLRTAERHLVPLHEGVASADRFAREQIGIMARAIPSMNWAADVAGGTANPAMTRALDAHHEVLHALGADLAPFRYHPASR